jgi:hypothetical protein
VVGGGEQARHGVVSEAAAGTFGYFAALPNELILCILSHTDPKTLLLSGTHLAGWLARSLLLSVNHGPR